MSAETVVSWHGSNNANTGHLLILIETLAVVGLPKTTDSCFSADHTEVWPCWLSSGKTCRLDWPPPTTDECLLCKSGFGFSRGGWILKIADSLSWSGLTPKWSTIWPRYFTQFCENAHFSLCVIPASWSRCKTLNNQLIVFLEHAVDDNMRRTAPFSSCSISDILH